MSHNALAHSHPDLPRRTKGLLRCPGTCPGFSNLYNYSLHSDLPTQFRSVKMIRRTILKSLIITAFLMLCLAATTRGETSPDNWSVRFSPGIGTGIPSDRSFGKDAALLLRLATDVHLFRGIVLRAPFVLYMDGGNFTSGHNVTVRGSVGLLMRSKLTKNPDFPSEFYFYCGPGIINLSQLRSGDTWIIADLSIGLQPALSSWLSLDFGYDLPLIFAFSEGRDGGVGSLTGPRIGVVLSL